MKKAISIILALLMLVFAFALASCSDNSVADPKNINNKFGLGISTEVSASDATADKNGKGTVSATAAAVVFDENGRIIEALLDCTDIAVEYTADGKAIANENGFSTKYDRGETYGMVEQGDAKKEWYAQANEFCLLVAGKTVEEVKALVAENGKGTDEVINVGCTIEVSEFAKAIEAAAKNAVASTAQITDVIRLGINTTQSTKDATADANGQNATETAFFAAVLSVPGGKVITAMSDSLEVVFSFDTEGKSTFDASKEVKTKKQQGADYGMVAQGGAKKEWFEEIAVFDAACQGKTLPEIAGSIGEDGKVSADVLAAGCTINMSGFKKAVAKLG